VLTAGQIQYSNLGSAISDQKCDVIIVNIKMHFTTQGYWSEAKSSIAMKQKLEYSGSYKPIEQKEILVL
jgi:hypothetical protein